MKGFKVFAEIELSTPREGSGTTSHLHEQMLAICMQDKGMTGIGESLLAWSMHYKKQVHKLLTMYTCLDTGKVPEGVKSFTLTLPEKRQVFRMIVDPNGDLAMKKDSQILHHLAKLFPQGLILKGESQSGGTYQLYLDFFLIATMSTVVSGTAEGLAGEIVGLICYALSPSDESGIDQKITGRLSFIQAGIESWLANAAQSSSILKKLMRGVKGFKLSAKIRNCSHLPCLNSEAGELPRVGISIHDDLLYELAKMPDGSICEDYLDENGKFDKMLLNGTVVGVGRAPMVMIQAAELVIIKGKDAEPGTLLCLGDAAIDLTSEASDDRVMTVQEMMAIRDGNHHLTSCGTNATHEGDTDGDGLEFFNLHVHTLGCMPPKE